MKELYFSITTNIRKPFIYDLVTANSKYSIINDKVTLPHFQIATEASK